MCSFFLGHWLELRLMQDVIEIEIKMKIRIETINVEFIYYLESFCST